MEFRLSHRFRMIVKVPDVIIIYIDRVKIVVLIVEPLEEILIIQILLNCPSSFRNTLLQPQKAVGASDVHRTVPHHQMI